MSNDSLSWSISPVKAIKYFLGLTALPLSFGAALAIAAVPARADVWDMAIAYPAGNYQTKGAERFASEVKKATAGAVSIVVQSGGALGFKGPEMLGAIEQGLVPLGSVLLSQQVGVEPLLGIGSLPFLVSGFDEMQIFTEIARPTYEKLAAKHNQKILYIIGWPGQHIFSKNPLVEVSDFRNMKIRTVDRSGSNFFRELGASPAQMPWGEVVPALATGVINSVSTSGSSAVDGQFWEFLNKCHLVYWQSNFDMVTVNLDAWKKLTPANQKTIEEIASKLEPEFLDAAKTEDNEKLATLASRGVVQTRPSKELLDYMISKAKPEWASFAQNTKGASEILDLYRARVRK